MSLPILQCSSQNTTQIRGDVTIDSTAMIAMGVILNATNGHKIVIQEGVCVGMGTVITAFDGDVIIKSNAILGAGSLILGGCIIGHQASLGTSVTVYQTDVSALTVIPAGSILGDRTRQIDLNLPSKQATETIKDDLGQKNQNISETSPWDEYKPSIEDKITPDEGTKETEKIEQEKEKEETEKDTSWQEENPPSQKGEVVGKVYINQLLFKLFPERQS